MLLEDLKSIVNDLKYLPGSVRVEVLDTMTGVKTEYSTKTAARLALQCSKDVLYTARTKLYKKRYKITVNSTADN
jgi:hypothetical protein